MDNQQTMMDAQSNPKAQQSPLQCWTHWKDGRWSTVHNRKRDKDEKNPRTEIQIGQSHPSPAQKNS